MCAPQSRRHAAYCRSGEMFRKLSDCSWKDFGKAAVKSQNIYLLWRGGWVQNGSEGNQGEGLDDAFFALGFTNLKIIEKKND